MKLIREKVEKLSEPARELINYHEVFISPVVRLELQHLFEIRRITDTARKVLDDNLDVLHKLAELLLEKETVPGAELDNLIISMKPEFKQTLKDAKNEQEADAES